MNKTRKTIITGLVMLLSIVIAYGFAEARVKGKCKDCHSMHYSYEGEGMTFAGIEGPFPYLTEGGCIGCHGQYPSGGENIIVDGKTRTPQVLHHMENADLASGNFYYVADGYGPDYRKGHNLIGISRQEDPPMNKPPGFIKGVVIPGGIGPLDWPEDEQLLTCAGKWGCHGDRNIEDPYEAMYGAHHADDSTIDGTSVGKSYRFLYGIVGVEHPDWEYLATINNHNGYKGNIAHDTMDTISYLCGECHAKFHPHPNLGGKWEVGEAYSNKYLWVRHPADIAFDTVHGGYAGSEYQGYIKYSLEAPVAFYEPTGGETEVDDRSIVMCLSCHRAHASPYPDTLRWDYANIFARSDAPSPEIGCLTCHTRK